MDATLIAAFWDGLGHLPALGVVETENPTVVVFDFGNTPGGGAVDGLKSHGSLSLDVCRCVHVVPLVIGRTPEEENRAAFGGEMRTLSILSLKEKYDDYIN